jgi:dipeptidyl aminopeptidase/acylaminoacyl peptidase
MAKPTRWIGWSVAGVAAIGLALCAIAGVVLCEATIRVAKKPLPAAPSVNANWRAVQITARDSAVLRAWLFAPAEPNGDFVLVLHGIADSRASQMGLASLLLENHYTVLTPDSRGHGESGGDIVTYGLREADDVHRWVDWLIDSEHARRVFGMGESLGAGVLLQSLAVEHRFSAVVAECPFASLQRVAEDRVAQRLPGPAWLDHALAVPMVWAAFEYARFKYGLDFRAASPENVIGGVSTPVLLIHGLEDTNIYPVHSRILASRNQAVKLWLVPGAKHTGAFAVSPEEFQRRVLGWFSEHAGRVVY